MNVTHQPALKEGCPECNPARRDSVAFTLIELLVVIATIAFLATILLPAVASTKPDSRAFQCQSNQRQLVLAWSMYTQDYNDQLVVNQDPFHAKLSLGISWAAGHVDWSVNTGNTNVLYLIDDRYALLGSYAGRQPSLYWCPADNYLTSAQRSLGWAHRVRSVAMNAAVGDGGKYTNFTWNSMSPFFVAKKSSQLLNPGPSRTWVFIDEQPDSNDDCIFYIDPYATGVGAESFTELPSSDHGGAGGMSFADGHAVIKRWQNAQTMTPVKFQSQNSVPVSNDEDLLFLGQATPK